MLGSDSFDSTYKALWGLFTTLFVAVLLFYIQLGRRFLVRRNEQEGMGPALNEPLAITFATVDGNIYKIDAKSRESYLFFFGAPGCQQTESLQRHLATLASTRSNLHVVVVYVADITGTRKFVETMEPWVLAVSDQYQELVRYLNIPGPPYLVAVDTTGVVRKKGIATSEKRLKYFFDA